VDSGCKWLTARLSSKIKFEGFQVIPKRWVVERIFAWLGNSRRSGKNCEYSMSSAETIVKTYNAGLYKSELARKFNVSRPTIYHWIKVLKQRRFLKYFLLYLF